MSVKMHTVANVTSFQFRPSTAAVVWGRTRKSKRMKVNCKASVKLKSRCRSKRACTTTATKLSGAAVCNSSNDSSSSKTRCTIEEGAVQPKCINETFNHSGNPSRWKSCSNPTVCSKQFAVHGEERQDSSDEEWERGEKQELLRQLRDPEYRPRSVRE